MATVTVNVQANTGEATQDINKLDASLNQAEQSADGLSNSLEQQEARIKTLGGAINLVGGSVEVLAGGLALTGALSEEQAEKFQTAAIGAIAFADGTKRIFEGYKELSEGLKIYGGVSGAATKATKFLNAAIKANPAVAIATALAALVVGIYAYITATDKATEAADRERDALIKLNEEKLNSLGRTIALNKAQGASIEEISELRKKELEQQLELVTLQRQALQNEGGLSKGVIKNREEIAKTGQEQLRIRNELKILDIETAAAIKQRDEAAKEAADREKERLQRLKDQARDAKLEYEGMMQVIQQTTEEVIESLDLLGMNSPLDEPLEQIEEFEEELENMVFFTREQLNAFNEATAINEDQSFEARRARMVAYYDDLIEQAASNAHQVEQLERAKNKTLDQLDQERRQNIEDAAQATLSTTISLLATIRETTEDGSKEGFEKSKKFRIAETRLSSIQAAFDAYKSLVGVPFVGPILGVAAAAAALAAGQKAINDIQSSTFDGGGGLSNPAAGAGGTPSSASTGGASGGGGGVPQIPGFGTSGVTTLNAVVLAGDVTSAQAQDAAIRNRRRFGRGG